MRNLSKMMVLLRYGYHFLQLNVVFVAQFSVVHFVDFKILRLYSEYT